MYTSLVSAKAAVIAVGEEIATLGLPSGICPLVVVFTGSGNGITMFLMPTLHLFTVSGFFCTAHAVKKCYFFCAYLLRG